MNHIRTDVSDESLVTAIRANLGDLFRHISRSAPEEHFEDGKFTRWYTPLPHPWFNGVLSSRLPEETDGGFIDETIQYFKGKEVKTFTWWMDPQLKRSDWEPHLSNHGFDFSNDIPGMAVDLQTLNESISTVDGLEVRVVADKESMLTWSHVFTLGYGLPPNWESLVFDVWFKLGLDSPIRNYLGFLNGKPVSTSSIFFGGGVAGVYDVATLPEARGKGIGAVLTLGPLLDAREMGYRIGILQSSEMGFNVYKKLGFRHLCQIEYFHKRND
jgi:GNAT superfamily N-acetyltransferase